MAILLTPDASRPAHDNDPPGPAHRSIWPALVLLAGVLGLVSWWQGPGFFSIDEPAYRFQAETLGSTGDWHITDPAERLVSPEFLPLANGERGADGWLAYSKHPLYIRILVEADRAAGAFGLAAVSILGAVAAVGFVADLVRRRGGIHDGRVVVGVLAVTTPLVVHGWILWAHTITVAAVAAIVWALDRSRDSLRWTPLVVAGAVVAPMLRSEASLVVPALVALALLEPNRRLGRLGLAGMVGGSGVAGFVLDRSWAARLEDGFATPGRSTVADPFTDLILGVWHTWFTPGTTDLLGLCRLLGAMAFIAAGAAAVRRLDAALPFAVAGSIAAGAGSLSLTGVHGLLPASPLAALGLGAIAGFMLDHRDSGVVPSRRTLLPLAIGVVTLTLLLPAHGGGVGWGGRYLLVLLPLAVPVVAHVRARVDPRRFAPVGLAVVVAGLAVTISGARLVAETHEISHRLAPEIAADLVAIDARLDAAEVAVVAVTEDLRIGRWAPAEAAATGLWNVDRSEEWHLAETEARRLSVCRVDVIELGVTAPDWPSDRWVRGEVVEFGRLRIVPWNNRGCGSDG